MEITFKDKVALVTGAAVGIGWAAARMFTEAGASVVLVDLNRQQVEERAKDLIASGHRAVVCPATCRRKRR